MPAPETSRQYLPDLEVRWQVSRRKILELARDGKLSLWIDLFGVRFAYMAVDGSEKEEWANNIELKFYLGSLLQLCANAKMGEVWHPCFFFEGLGKKSGINGVLRDGRKVLVWSATEPTNHKGIITIKYSEVFADIDEVRRLDQEFKSRGGGEPAADQDAPIPEQGSDEIIWTWAKMNKHTGLTRGRIRYRAKQLGFEIKKQLDDVTSSPGLRTSELNMIARYKRTNAVT